MVPLACRMGTKTTQHNVPPSSMLAPARMPINAPPAMKMGSHWNNTVRPIQAGPNVATLNLPNAAPRLYLENPAPSRCMPSIQNWLMAASTPPVPSARAERAARAPSEYKVRSVTAAAIPVGKRSCSTLTICRFIGIAMVTPSTASTNTQANISPRGREVPLIMM